MTEASNEKVSRRGRSAATAPGNSLEQQEAEDQMIRLVAQSLGVAVAKRRFELPAGGWLEIDGFSEAPRVLCEAWAHIGKPKSAQKNKVMADAMKLIFASALGPAPERLILAFADEDAASHFRGDSWMAQALKAKNIETVVVELPNDVRRRVLLAQKRQYR
jgi:hypothetical protein